MGDRISFVTKFEATPPPDDAEACTFYMDVPPRQPQPGDHLPLYRPDGELLGHFVVDDEGRMTFTPLTNDGTG